MSATRPAAIGDWLGRRATLSPRALALIDVTGPAPQSYDYAALDRRTNQVARWLVAQGVGRGDAVALLSKNRLEYLLLWFACGKLGAVLVPLNWRLSARELVGLVAAAAPRLGCGEDGPELGPKLAALREASEHPWLSLDGPQFAAHRTESDAAVPRVELDADDPWVLCHTGGSTGQPKAAILTHATITWNAINTVSSWGLGESDLAVLNAPLFHTGGLNVFTAPLVYAGGASILCRGFDVDELFGLLEDHPVTCLFGVPAMFQAMQAHPHWDRAPLERVRRIISGGAPCPEPVFERFWARGVAFKTGYGLTEAGPNNFWLPDARTRDKPGAVGWPLMHVDIRIVDTQGRDCGVDEVGELWIRGPHVSPGYFRDASATAATFVDGWLHTGDLARADDEGCVSIAGRRKDLIISGGENIYPAQVESVISGHPAVIEAAVIGVPDARWGEVGRAIVVCRPGATLSSDELRTFLREQLAHYKVPHSVVFVDALPRTSAGKLDKPALVRRYGDS